MKFALHLNAGMNEHMRFERVPERDTRVRKPSEYSALHKQVVNRPNGPPKSTPPPAPPPTPRRPSLDPKLSDVKDGLVTIGKGLNGVRKDLVQEVGKKLKRTEKEPQPEEEPTPFAHVDKVMLRHSDRKASFVPEDWHPGMRMGEEVIQGRICYSTVNCHPKPNRYYRGPSTEPFPHPGLKVVLRTLEITLRRDSKRMVDHFSAKEVLNGELWDQEEQDGLKEVKRRKEVKFRYNEYKRDMEKASRDCNVFGGHLKIINEKASTIVFAHGWRLQVPVVVAACVEEIYSRGMGMLDLLDKCQSRQRVVELMVAFNELQDDVTVLPDLSQENIYDVASLLGLWMNSNPEPLIHRTFCDAYSDWCAEPSTTREREAKGKILTKRRRAEDGEYYSETDTEAEALEEEDEQCPGLPSFHSRKKKMRKRQRAIERAKRDAFAAQHPEQVVSNRPTHQQRKMQMYRELLHLEKAQVNHARLILMLLAPHCFETLLYLMTFLASLLDYPTNDISAEIIADKFSKKLFGGPNTAVSRELMEWLLTRWERIVEGLKSEKAMAWEKRRNAQENRRGSQGFPAQSTLSQHRQSRDEEPAPQYERGSRRTSDASDRSAAPSYHSTHELDPRSKETRSSSAVNVASSSTHSSTGSRHGSGNTSGTSSRRSSAASEARVSTSWQSRRASLAPLPQFDDLNPGVSLCGPQPSPASVVELTNPWVGESTPVIDESCEYEAEDEDNEGSDVEDGSVCNNAQRTEFSEIQELMDRPSRVRLPSVQSVQTESATSVYSQDDDFDIDELAIVNGYSQQRRPSQAAEAGQLSLNTFIHSTPVDTAMFEDADADTELKRRFEEALRERELAQQKLEVLSKMLQGAQLR